MELVNLQEYQQVEIMKWPVDFYSRWILALVWVKDVSCEKILIICSLSSTRKNLIDYGKHIQEKAQIFELLFKI